MVTLTTGMFLVFNSMQFVCGEFYEGGPRVHRANIKWPAIAESLRNTAVDHERFFNSEDMFLRLYSRGTFRWIHL
jgi:hypothetical protein